MNAQIREDTLAAIAVVTAAHGEKGENKTLAAHVAQEWADETPNGHSRLVNGFVQLSNLLLAQLMATDKTPEAALQEAAELINSWPDEEV